MQTILRWPGIARCGTIIRSFRANMVPNWGLIGYDRYNWTFAHARPNGRDSPLGPSRLATYLQSSKLTKTARTFPADRGPRFYYGAPARGLARMALGLA